MPTPTPILQKAPSAGAGPSRVLLASVGTTFLILILLVMGGATMFMLRLRTVEAAPSVPGTSASRLDRDGVEREERSAGVSQSRIAPPLTVKTTAVTSLEVVKGLPEWARNEEERIQSSTWYFAPDGGFVYTPGGDGYTINGTYQIQGTQLHFDGRYEWQVAGTGSGYSMIVGTIDFTGDSPTLTMTSGGGQSSAAVVNGQQFAGSSASEFRITAEIYQVE